MGLKKALLPVERERHATCPQRLSDRHTVFASSGQNVDIRRLESSSLFAVTHHKALRTENPHDLGRKRLAHGLLRIEGAFGALKKRDGGFSTRRIVDREPWSRTTHGFGIGTRVSKIALEDLVVGVDHFLCGPVVLTQADGFSLTE